jgi:hypothetical protein
MKPLWEIRWPRFEEFFDTNQLNFDDLDLKFNYLVLSNLDQLIFKKYHRYQDIDWDHIIYFKKSNMAGSIHTDNTKLTSDRTIWGINWVIDGDGRMDFWDQSQVTPVGLTNGSLNRENFGIVTKFIANDKPSSSFILKRDHVYLINASQPHRAIGFNQRKIFSLRVDPMTSHWSWESLLKKFQHRMIPP